MERIPNKLVTTPVLQVRKSGHCIGYQAQKCAAQGGTT